MLFLYWTCLPSSLAVSSPRQLLYESVYSKRICLLQQYPYGTFLQRTPSLMKSCSDHIGEISLFGLYIKYTFACYTEGRCNLRAMLRAETLFLVVPSSAVRRVQQLMRKVTEWHLNSLPQRPRKKQKRGLWLYLLSWGLNWEETKGFSRMQCSGYQSGTPWV